MTNKYQMLADLEGLRKNGTLSEEEYQRERAKIMDAEPMQQSSSDLFGMDEKTYLPLMHLSQFAGMIVVGLGFLVPFFLWLANKDKNENVDLHGKNILNFIFSWLIYYAVAGVLCFVLIGIPILAVLAILQIIFIILGSIKASEGQLWKYPMAIPFFNLNPNAYSR